MATMKSGDMAKNYQPKNLDQSQSVPIKGRESEMKATMGGGFAFNAPELTTIRRFLILGASNGYYAKAETYADMSSFAIKDALNKGLGLQVLKLIEEVNTASVEGGEAMSDDIGYFLTDNKFTPAAAVRKNPSIFALAVCHFLGDDQIKAEVHNIIRRRIVISTLRQMFDFMNVYYTLTGGWQKGHFPSGNGMRKAISDWMLGSGRDLRWLSIQFIKYRSGSYSFDGNKSHHITGADLLRSFHVKPNTEIASHLFKWVVDRNDENGDELTRLKSVVSYTNNAEALSNLIAFEEIQRTDDYKRIIDLLDQYRLPWEVVPNTWFSESKKKERKAIWRSLLGLNSKRKVSTMGLTALIRNISRLSAYGVFDDMDAIEMLSETLTGSGSMEALTKARVHPIRLLSALRVYESGEGSGSEHRSNAMTWTPNDGVAQMLRKAFYASFGTVGTSGVRQVYGIDVSGSMEAPFGLIPGLTSRDAAAVMAMVCARNEKSYYFYGFSDTISRLNISPEMSLDAVKRVLSDSNFGSTNPSLLAQHCMKNKIPADAFIIITDNDLNTGKHPTNALNAYRYRMGIQSRMVVIATMPNDYSIADPNDPLQMDVVGFDATAPAVIADFCAGRI